MKLLLMSVLIFIIASCTKDKPFANTGVVVGPDVRVCACCGGLYFHFTNVSDTTNKPLVNPGIFQFSKDVKYPVYVQVDWQSETNCMGAAIRIVRYKVL